METPPTGPLFVTTPLPAKEATWFDDSRSKVPFTVKAEEALSEPVENANSVAPASTVLGPV
jgi:hypothetical protein